CDFGLHEDCATCPEYLTSSFHPNHQLEWVWEEDYGMMRPCNLCGDQVKGLFYKCSSGAAGIIISSSTLHAPNFHLR
ncbi:hypothetical protein MKW98_001527, partial [Papaver atlanticum]